MWSTKSFRAGGHKYDPDIREYDLLSDIGKLFFQKKDIPSRV